MTAVAVIAMLLGSAVLQILCHDTAIVEESVLGIAEANPVLFLVGEVLARIPLEGDRHGLTLAQVWAERHIRVWRCGARPSAG
jgi:hypothetical protein